MGDSLIVRPWHGRPHGEIRPAIRVVVVAEERQTVVHARNVMEDTYFIDEGRAAVVT